MELDFSGTRPPVSRALVFRVEYLAKDSVCGQVTWEQCWLCVCSVGGHLSHLGRVAMRWQFGEGTESQSDKIFTDLCGLGLAQL